ncbi:MAG TPA: hypothetical protein VKV05_06545 [Terriglobales bacterium]|nr:hypothetical protein [Terriglobales bacterium]
MAKETASGPTAATALVEAPGAPEMARPTAISAIEPGQPAPSPGKPVQPAEVLYDSCGMELVPDTPALDLGPADIPTPSFGGYTYRSKGAPVNRADREIHRLRRQQAPEQAGVPARKSRLPVLEILVAVLLVGGAAIAVWMLRSSLPAKSAASAAPTVSISISPTSAEVAAGKALDFAATITGTNDARVTWTIQEGDEGGRIVTHGAKVEGGTVSSMAVYIAPHKPGTYHLLATSNADPQKSAYAEITVTKTESRK